MEEWKLGYLGGIIDGEGSIIIEKQAIRRRERVHNYRLRVEVSGTDKRLMDWLEENFGGKAYMYEAKGNRRRSYSWRNRANDAYKLLKIVKPYLVFKTEQADLGIEFYEKNKNRVQGERVPMWLVSRREEYYQRMKDFHSPNGTSSV